MLLNKNLSLHQVFLLTWKIDLLMIAFCSVVYAFFHCLFPELTVPLGYPTLIGMAIAFFIGFNNNQAYGRWWEARIIWGSLVNNSRSWARNLVSYPKHEAELARLMIFRHIAFLKATASTLRDDHDCSYLDYLNASDRESLNVDYHIPNQILNLQARDLARLRSVEAIDSFGWHDLNHLLESFCDDLGRSERIKYTVFPTTYVYFTHLFIWLFIALITSSIANLVGPVAIVLGWLIGFVFNTIHLNGMFLMTPFADFPTGVPINSITRKIEIDLLQTLGESNIPEPLQPIDNEYIM